MPLALGVWSLNCWTAREVLLLSLKKKTSHFRVEETDPQRGQATSPLSQSCFVEGWDRTILQTGLPFFLH